MYTCLHLILTGYASSEFLRPIFYNPSQQRPRVVEFNLQNCSNSIQLFFFLRNKCKSQMALERMHRMHWKELKKIVPKVKKKKKLKRATKKGKKLTEIWFSRGVICNHAGPQKLDGISHFRARTIVCEVFKCSVMSHKLHSEKWLCPRLSTFKYLKIFKMCLGHLNTFL